MSFFDTLFHKKKDGESVILIDIGAESVAGAYVRYEETETPALLYSRSLPIEIHAGEAHERAMLRALGVLGNDLIREGAPVLARHTGSGSADKILVSVDAPWQETDVRTEHFEESEPFVFTKGLVDARLEETRAGLPEKLLVDESIIGTILNGYETRSPYGKRARRATIIVLTSLIRKDVANSIIQTFESLFHTKDILPIAGNSLRYQVMRELFPHERDAIILDATGGSLTSVALVRKGVFASLVQVSNSSESDSWVSTVKEEFAEIAKRYPLPRTIFLLAREPEILSLQEKLESADFGALWFSDTPPKIIPVLRSNIPGAIRQVSIRPADIVLLFMAFYHQYQRNAQ